MSGRYIAVVTASVGLTVQLLAAGPAPSGKVVAPPLLVSGSQVFAPVVSGSGVQVVGPAALAAASIVRAPSVSLAGTTTISPPFLASTAAVQAPSIAPSAVTLALPLLTSGSSLFAPVVNLGGALTIAPSMLASASVVRAPNVGPGAVAITAPLLASGSVVLAPGLAAGAVTVAPGLLASGSALFAPVVAPPAIKVLIEGDSITAYSPTSPSGGWDSYARLWQAAHTAITSSNTAVGGATTASSSNSLYGRKTTDLAYAPTILYVLIGANDGIDTVTTASWISALYAYTDSFRATGCKVIVGTILSREPSGNAANWNAARAAIRTQLLADVGTKIDDVVDFNTTTMGADNAYADSAKFVDGLHPTSAGDAILLRAFAPVMNHWVGIANEPLDFAFAPQAAATADTDYDSPAYTVIGLYAGESRPYSVQSGRYVSKNGSAFVLNGSGTVVNGDTLKVRNHSSASNATQTNVTATIGTTTATYSVTTAGAGSRDWVPTDLGSKLAFWVRPEGLTGADGTNINTWADESGNGRTATAAGSSGGGGRPTVQASAINGLKAAVMAGAQQTQFNLPTSTVTGRTSMATFFVSKNVSATPASYVGALIGGWGSNREDYFPYTDGTIYYCYGRSTRLDTNVTPPTMASWHQYMLLSAPSDWRLTQDGTNLYTSAANTVSPGSAPRLGQSSTGNWDGVFAEVVDMNVAPTATEKGLVEGYLAWKYGLQANLPSGHPYKSAKPTI